MGPSLRSPAAAMPMLSPRRKKGKKKSDQEPEPGPEAEAQVEPGQRRRKAPSAEGELSLRSASVEWASAGAAGVAHGVELLSAAFDSVGLAAAAAALAGVAVARCWCQRRARRRSAKRESVKTTVRRARNPTFDPEALPVATIV